MLGKKFGRSSRSVHCRCLMLQLRQILTPANFCRLAALLLCLQAFHQVDNSKSPWKTAWGRRTLAGESPSYNEHVKAGHWFGAQARGYLLAGLLAASVGWGLKTKPQTLTRLEALSASPMSAKTFCLGLGVIVLVALAMRAPRMTHSFWGDESDAIATYAHGMWRAEVKNDIQGPMRFEQPSWEQSFYSARHGANNHVLFTLSSRSCLWIWQKATGRPETEFAEWVIRLPCLFAGLGSLIALACLLRHWGSASLGLLTTAFMSLHPWHVRYSTEARGYALALCLLPLLLLAITKALERGHWLSWLSVAAGQFALMYSWGGTVYPLLVLNLVLGCWILLRQDRWAQASRWITANLLSAAVFITLYAPQVPQIADARKRLLWIKGFPMDEEWFHNVLVSPFTGVHFHQAVKSNASELSWQSLYGQSPLLTVLGFGVILVAFFVGMTSLWKRSRVLASLITAFFVAAVISVLHFKFILEDELRTWYLLFTLPALSLCVVMGLRSLAQLLGKTLPLMRSDRTQRFAVIALLLFPVAALWPVNASLVTQPEEDFKGALAASRLRSETFDPNSRSQVMTAWLWRFSSLYDPRGDSYVRSLATLQNRMAKARELNAEFYMVVGYRTLAEAENKEVMAVLENPTQFDKLELFPARESLHTLEVYHMKK
jgi:hypothetical protein